MTTNRSEALREIYRGLIVAGVILVVAFTLKSLSPRYLSPELVRRSLQVLMGAMVVFYSNAAPKALTPLVQMRCNPESEQATRRFAAWTLVLGGVAYAVVWAVAPLEYAHVLAMSLLGASLLLVVTRLAWKMARGARS